MSKLPLVILHGWSDNYESFKPLAKKLKDEGIADSVKEIHLANYVSMDDLVEYHDLVDAMMRAWNEKELPTDPRSTNVVVHSTGGLVIRDWMRTLFCKQVPPVHHLLMLAPANFGSPLAHMGRSFIGRLFKGWHSSKPFQTGTRILKGLELSSPYSTALAQDDLFAEETIYKPGKVLCTVLVGNRGYSGLKGIANRDGSDGTVYVATANLQTAHLKLDYAKTPLSPQWALTPCTCRTAFGVMDGENHGSITGGDSGFIDPQETFKWIVRGLTVEDDKFEGFRTKLDVHTDAVMAANKGETYTHGYQNTVFHLNDQYNSGVPDYFLQFFEHDEDQNDLSELFHRDAINKVHPYEDDKSYRSIFVDCTALKETLEKIDNYLEIRLYASPEVEKEGNVGYHSFSPNDLGSIKIKRDELKTVFSPNRTLLVEMIIKRHQSKQVFEFKSMNDE